MITLAIALAAVQPVQVPPPATAAPAVVDKARIAAALRLLDVTKIEQQYDEILSKMIPLMTTQVFSGLKDNVTVPAKLRAFLSDDDNRARATRIFSDEAAAAFKERYPTMREATAREYARIFTTEELDGLAAFYATPLGKKALNSLPELQNKLMPIGMVAGSEAGRIAMLKMIEKLDLDREPGAHS